ncbi:MAG TPA: Holliday junction resolvase RuvX [Vicinamibacterales bacterium]|nr:Holliday junction resolvase RuvX [Vicinamibacterales bacterium]
MRVLGIDYGGRRIGLALSDPSGMIASPWKTIPHAGGLQEVASTLSGEIGALLAEADGLAAVVLGHPRRLSGESTGQTATVEALADALRARVTVPIVLQDERLSSREAESRLAERIKDWRKRKALLDAASAAVILQDYLDGLPSRGIPASEEESA